MTITIHLCFQQENSPFLMHLQANYDILYRKLVATQAELESVKAKVIG